MRLRKCIEYLGSIFLHIIPFLPHTTVLQKIVRDVFYTSELNDGKSSSVYVWCTRVCAHRSKRRRHGDMERETAGRGCAERKLELEAVDLVS